MAKKKIKRNSNIPLSIDGSNYFSWGGDIKNAFSGAMFKNAFSASNVLGGLSGIAGNLVNKGLSFGLSSGAGNTISSLGTSVGSAVGAVNPILGGAISLGSGLIGGATNALFGSKLNTDKINEIEASNNQMNNLKVDNSSINSVDSQWASQNFGDNFTRSDIGKDGLFSNKAKNKFRKLTQEQEIARNRALNVLNNATESADINNDLRIAANFIAFGGPLNTNKSNMNNIYADGGTLFSNGADFSNGVTYINNGGTHEANSMNGVPFGMDNSGNPNLVEEGEVIYDDYVYSNRLQANKKLLKEVGLPQKYDGYTFAAIAEDLSKESKERPNDPISKRGLNASMTKLQQAQEMVRQLEAIKNSSSQMAYQNPSMLQNVPQEVPQEQLGMSGENMGEVPQEEMGLGSIASQGEPKQFASGGDINYLGGPYKLYEDSPFIIPLTEHPFETLNKARLDLGKADKERAIYSFRNNWSDLYGNPYIQKKTYPKIGYYFDKVKGETPNHLFANRLSEQWKIPINIDYNRDIAGKEDYWIKNNKKSSDFNYKELFPEKAPTKKEDIAALKKKRTEYLEALKRSELLAEYQSRQYETNNPPILGVLPKNVRAIAEPYKKDINGNYIRDQYGLVPNTIQNPKFNTKNIQQQYYNDLEAQKRKQQSDNLVKLRYAPVVGAALGFMQNMLSKPDYSSSDAVLNAAKKAGDFTPVSYDPIGNYLQYTPFDRDYYINKLGEQAGATRSAIMNSNNPSRNASLLAADYNTQNQLGELAKKAEEYNFSRRQAVETFNKQTNATNSELGLKAAMANQTALAAARQQELSGILQAMKLRDDVDARRAASINANLTNFFDSLGNIGKEEFTRNMVNDNPAWYYEITKDGHIIYGNGYDYLSSSDKEKVSTAAKQELNKRSKGSAYGGYLTIKKK